MYILFEKEFVVKNNGKKKLNSLNIIKIGRLTLHRSDLFCFPIFYHFPTLATTFHRFASFRRGSRIYAL